MALKNQLGVDIGSSMIRVRQWESMPRIEGAGFRKGFLLPLYNLNQEMIQSIVRGQ